MSFAQLKALREKRAGLVNQAGKTITDAGATPLTSEQIEQVRKLHEDAKALDPQIETLERQADLEAELREGSGRKAHQELDVDDTARRALSADAGERTEQETRAWETWVREGAAGLSAEERAILGGRTFDVDKDEERMLRRELRRELRDENRAQSAATGAKGGYTVPQGPMEQLERAVKAFADVLSISTVMQTNDGRTIPIPMSDDTSNEGELIDENAEVNESEVAYTQKTIGAYKVTSRLVRIPLELIEDTGYDIVGDLTGALGERVGRTINRYATFGTGTGEPEGVLTAATLGKTSAAASSLAYGDLFGLTGSVDPAYRVGPKVRHMFSDATLQLWKQVVDGAGRLIFQRDLAGGTPGTLDGFPYSINQLMASVAATNKVQLFGDFSKFVIRRVKGIRVVRLAERFAELDQVGFVAFHRFDSKLKDAGQHPIKYLQMHA